MSKLSYEDKINIYIERKAGKTLANISQRYQVGVEVIKYLVRLIDKHSFDILKTCNNNNYSKHEKERIINRILLNNESIKSVAIEEGILSYGMLSIWVKNYIENGYNIVERKRGRSPTMIKKPNKTKKETSEETIKRLENENEYLKAELEYSKKLRVVVQQRKNQQQKKE